LHKVVSKRAIQRASGGNSDAMARLEKPDWHATKARLVLAALARIGWRIKRHYVDIKVFFGPDIERHKLWPGDPGNRLQGSDFGVRFATELWYEPTPDTMVASELSLSTIATNMSARFAVGWRVCEDIFEDGFYIGPETQYFGSDGYRHVRFGLHITDLRAENYEWSWAVGVARDSDGMVSPYLRLGLSMRQ